jgi:hypothetical protein
MAPHYTKGENIRILLHDKIPPLWIVRNQNVLSWIGSSKDSFAKAHLDEDAYLFKLPLAIGTDDRTTTKSSKSAKLTVSKQRFFNVFPVI